MVLDNLRSKSICVRCGKHSILTDGDTEERFCGKCGYVILEKIEDSGPEWISISRENTDPRRTGPPTSLTMHDKGLATIIGPINRDSSGKPLSSSMKTTFERLRTWDSRSQVHESASRNLRQALRQLGTLKDKLTISSSVIEKSAYIYRKALEKNLTRGRSISVLLAASLYAACRETETPRTLTDVAAALNIKRKDIAKCYRLLHHELDLRMPVVDSIQCVARISSKLEISEKTQRSAIKILNTAKQNEESAGKKPMVLAAAALYLSCIEQGQHITQREIAEAANVTEVSIRNRHKGLKLE